MTIGARQSRAAIAPTVAATPASPSAASEEGDAGVAATREGAADIMPILIAVALFSLFSITCAISSDGFLEADSCTHYLYARFAFAEPVKQAVRNEDQQRNDRDQPRAAIEMIAPNDFSAQ